MPVYNEVNTLLKILDRVQVVPVEKELIIVSDYSTDGTRELLKKYQQSNPGNVKIFYFDQNRGKGAALRCGIHYAEGDFVIVQDADLEYDPNDYLTLLKVVEERDAAVVYGSRFLGQHKNFSKSHYWGNKMLTIVFNLLYGSKLTDMETCYKLWRRDVIQNIKLRSNRFNVEPEVTAKVLKQKIKIHEVPITYEARAFDEGKKISWKDGFSALWTILKYRVIN
jgi:glycosyltransferase involved in cell wall biosynthesis